MNTILTDDEIKAECRVGFGIDPVLDGNLMKFARAVEAAVLAKLEGQKPVAWRWQERGHWFGWSSDWGDHDKAQEMGFQIEYAYPKAAPQQADRQRVPEGWGADPSAAAVELAKMIMSDCGLAVEHRHDLLGRIAARIEKFAAAPEAPAQASAVDEREKELVWLCAEAYQVVASMLHDLKALDTEKANKILDNLSQARFVHDDVLPWPELAPANTRNSGELEASAVDERADWIGGGGQR